jgi:hypothetical protein
MEANKPIIIMEINKWNNTTQNKLVLLTSYKTTAYQSYAVLDDYSKYIP